MPNPNNYVIFPSGMPEKATIAAGDKTMWSDSENSGKPAWKAYTELVTNLSLSLAAIDASNLSSANKDLWKTALSVAFRTDSMFDGTGIDVHTISENGYYATDATTTNIPADNRVGVLMVLNYDTDKKFLTYRTIVTDLPKVYYQIYNGSAWSAWISIDTPDLTPYLLKDGSNLTTESSEKDTWRTWLIGVLENREFADLLLTDLDAAYTPTEKQTWWGQTTKSIKTYLQTLVARAYTNYVNIAGLQSTRSMYTDGVWWTLSVYADRATIAESKRKIGDAVTYEVSTGFWLTERFVGADVTDTNWNDDNNWETVLDDRREIKNKVYTVPNNSYYDLYVGNKTVNVQMKVEYSAERGTGVQVGEIRYIVTSSTVKFYPGKFETIAGLTLTKYENGNDIYLRITLDDNVNDCKFEYSIFKTLKN